MKCYGRKSQRPRLSSGSKAAFFACVMDNFKKDDIKNEKSKLVQLCKFFVLELPHITKRVHTSLRRSIRSLPKRSASRLLA